MTSVSSMTSTSAATRLFTRADAVGIAVLALVSVGAHFMVVQPFRTARADALAGNAELSTMTHALSTLESEVRSARDTLADVEKQLRSALALEPASSLNQRMAAIPELGDACGVRVREVIPRAPQPGRRFTRVPLTIGGEGPPGALNVFLRDLHARFPDTEITTFTIAARTDDPQEPARFTLEMVWYAQAGSDAPAGDAGSSSRRAP